MSVTTNYEGYRAARKGLSERENPYTEGSLEWEGWCLGWYAYHDNKDEE